VFVRSYTYVLELLNSNLIPLNGVLTRFVVIFKPPSAKIWYGTHTWIKRQPLPSTCIRTDNDPKCWSQ